MDSIQYGPTIPPATTSANRVYLQLDPNGKLFPWISVKHDSETVWNSLIVPFNNALRPQGIVAALYWKLPKQAVLGEIALLVLRSSDILNPFIFVKTSDKLESTEQSYVEWTQIKESDPCTILSDIDIFYDAEKEFGKFPTQYSLVEGCRAIQRYIHHASNTAHSVTPDTVFRLDAHSKYFVIDNNDHTGIVDVTPLMATIIEKHSNKEKQK